MVIKKLNLETVCGITSKLPVNTLPEIALVGRSNVGKSSLINGLMYRKAYAKTSSTPGKTQTINFYRINDDLYLVDLPGYGYTKIAKSESDKWAKMINDYLEGSKQLRAIFLLLDIRRKPNDMDKAMFQWILHYNYMPVIIATKSDKVGPSKLEEQKKMILESLDAPENTRMFAYSALKKTGRDEIWEFIETEILTNND